MEVLIHSFKDGKLLCKADVMEILARVGPLLQDCQNLVLVDLQKFTKLTIVGDIHGHMDDLTTILRISGNLFALVVGGGCFISIFVC